MRFTRAATLSALAHSTLYLATMAADDIATTSPETDTPDWLSNESLALTLDNSATPGLHYPVLPLTPNMGLNGSSNVGLTMNIHGDITLADQNNFNRISGLGHTAYLCCDNPDSQDSFNISPNKMLNQLMGANLSAIILYSAQTNWCSFERNSGPDYSSIVTMADKGDAADVLKYITASKSSNQTVAVSIMGNSSATEPQGSSGGSHSTVAMSVLYSITGLITLLFLAIIITGTVRAHRHPERYGPRSGFGRRPRQSRAKGIARAVLDTLPIVKFGNDDQMKPDPDLELEPAPTNTEEHQRNAVAAGGLAPETENDAEKEPAKEKQETRDFPETGHVENTTTESAIAETASAQESSGQGGDEHLGCSICTEDFTVGEDVRVLPCNHQFHPGCVDPWLLDVSGTCPLCRYDLQPNREADSIATESSPGLPPPLALEADENESASSRHKTPRFLDLHRLRHLPHQERIEALRAMRNRNEETEPAATAGGADIAAQGASENADGEETGRAARLATKLRDKFRIRTRAQT